MAAVGDDCYFFCTSTCAKGPACPFRHVESAKTNKIVCQHWQTTGCFRPLCKFRHSDFHIQVNYSEIPCYWEGQPVGCSKPNCVYKHSKPRPLSTNTATPQTKAASPEQNDDDDKSNEVKETVFVMPTVKPVIIDPESEASNSSPVKKPPPKDSPEKETRKETKSPNNEADGKEVEKKAVKVVGKKKKAGVLTQKNGKSGIAKKVIKKVKKNADGSPATKVPIKKKRAVNAKTGESVVPSKKKVQDRLGTKPAPPDASSQKKKVQKESSSSSSDSDDSIENVKVLSMEEIFRQKALESMMKKRAADGKPMMPEYGSSQRNSNPVRSQPPKPVDIGTRLKKPMAVDSRPKKTIESRLKKPIDIKSRLKKPIDIDSRPKKPIVNNRVKKVGIKKKAPLPPPPPQESEDEEEDVTETEEEEIERRAVVDEEESSSSESESSSSDSSESEDDEVRRVVINLDAEKTAREKAKASLAKRRHVDVRSDVAKKRKVVREDKTAPLFSRSVNAAAQQRVSIKDRLGKPTSTVVSSRVARRNVKNVSSTSSEEDEMEEDKEGTDDEHFSGVNIKSLDNIRQDKLNRLSNSPIKDRLGPSKIDDVEDEQDGKGGREILLSEDVSTTPTKSRKRPWSSGKKTQVIHETRMVEEDQRTVSATSPVDPEPVIILHSEEPESPYESLRRRALLKKNQQLQEDMPSEEKVEESEELDVAEEEEAAGGKRKKHKHKHKHKKHKKSKSERQIYVPPPKKSVITEVLEQVKKVPSLLSLRYDIPDYEDQGVKDTTATSNLSSSKTATTKAPQQPRAKPRAAAMWSAGLSVSSKGLGARPHLRMGLAVDDLGGDDDDEDLVSVPCQRPSLVTSKMSNSPRSSASVKDDGSSVPVVKTFSQIMAEKRQKRMQHGEESGGGNDNSTGSPSKLSLSPSRMSSRVDDSRPRAPITPIRFDIRGESNDVQPPRAKPVKSATSSVLNCWGVSKPAPSSSLFSSSIASAVTAKSHHQSPINKDINVSSSLPTFGSSKSSLPTFGSSKSSLPTFGSSKSSLPTFGSSKSLSSSTASLSDIRPTYKTARAKKMFNKKASPTAAATTQSDSPPMSDSPTHISSSSMAGSSHHHHHHNHSISLEIKSSPVSSGDAAVALKSPTTGGKKQRRVSNASDSHPKQATPLDDEFSFFDGGDDIEDIGDIVGKDVEPIDDLLQDIDDLLA